MAVFLWMLLFLASPATPQDDAAAIRAAAGCGPEWVQFDVHTDKKKHPFAAATQEKAVVYVFEDEIREETWYIGSVLIRVGLDGAWVGATKGRSYFFFTVAPGEHHLCADRHIMLQKSAKLTSAVSLTAEAGKVYFFRARVEERNEPQYPPSVKLEQVTDNAQAMLLVSSSAFSVSHAKK